MTEMTDTMKQMKDSCDSLRDKLIAFHKGLVYDSQTGEMIEQPSRDDSDEYGDEGEFVDLYGYLMDNLGIKVVMGLPVTDSDNLSGCIITMAWGGPNIYIDTYEGRVSGHWWSEHYDTYLPREVCEDIDDLIRELIFETY